MRNRIFLLVVIMAFLFSGVRVNAQEGPTDYQIEATAEITPVMGYQGRLVEAGVPVTGTRSMTFSLFNVQTSGTQIWSETKDVIVSDGLFQTALGDTTPFTDAIRVNMTQNLWLQVSVGGTTLPRQQLMGSPYAFTLAPGAVIQTTLAEIGLSVNNTNPGGLGLDVSGAIGISGTGTSGTGVTGLSSSGHGIVASSQGVGDAGAALWAGAYDPAGVALYAQAVSTLYSGAIVNTGAGLGLYVSGTGGIYSDGGIGVGVQGTSASDYGMKGYSESNIGVLAQSRGSGLNGPAIEADALAAGGIGIVATAGSTDSTIVSINNGTGSLFNGFGGNGGGEEFILLNDGTVKQALDADGLVKAGLFATCNMLNPGTIYRSFNNAGGEITLGNSSGKCLIDFGFDLSQRFWSAGNLACEVDPANHNQLICDPYTNQMFLIY